MFQSTPLNLMKVSLILLVGVLASFSAQAKCDGAEKTVFSCLTGKAKQIEVCDAGKTISYSFGYPNAKPEIVVTVPRERAKKEYIVGVGCIRSSVTIPNGDTVYRVYAMETLRDLSCPDAGVEVYIKRRYTTAVKCKGSYTNNIAETQLLEQE
ncbi:MAG: hypothetical protein RIR79_29 [Pseudomonadota bacterium]|jgi:5-formaminoimidazole-4-carboxamide-1-beta-D-ribofuranosyl 5'-monophosphate synthetase